MKKICIIFCICFEICGVPFDSAINRNDTYICMAQSADSSGNISGRKNDRSLSEKKLKNSGKIKKKKISKQEFLQRIDTVYYCITNVEFLFPTTTKRALVEQFNEALNKQIDEQLQQHALANFRKLEDRFTQQFTIAFNVVAPKNNGIVDTLPYAIRERCLENHINNLAVFYIYKIHEATEFLNDESDIVHIPFEEFAGVAGHVVPSVSIHIDDVSIANIQIGFAFYNVTSQKLFFADTGSDDEYDNVEEMVEELFEHIKLR
jgi:hypothetical protein